MTATEVTAGLAESNGSLLPGLWRDSLHVTCGLTACTPGSAPGPTQLYPFLPLQEGWLKMQDVKVTDQLTRRENAGCENARREMSIFWACMTAGHAMCSLWTVKLVSFVIVILNVLENFVTADICATICWQWLALSRIELVWSSTSTQHFTGALYAVFTCRTYSSFVISRLDFHVLQSHVLLSGSPFVHPVFSAQLSRLFLVW